MKEPSRDAQIDRFKQAARELGCDESEAAFDEKIKAIVKRKTKVDECGSGEEKSSS